MALIRPCADLRNNYNEISKICHETKEPIYITKNGASDLVILSNSVYEALLERNKEIEEERIERLIEKKFAKHFATMEEFKADLIKHIEQAEKDIKEGDYQTMEECCAELEEKYGFKEIPNTLD